VKYQRENRRNSGGIESKISMKMKAAKMKNEKLAKNGGISEK